MAKGSASYLEGKTGESQTWALLEKHGYFRPTKHERDDIYNHFMSEGIEIEKRGFDVYKKENGFYFIYEVKTTGISRGASVSTDFCGLGFTLTAKEINNAKLLGDRYAFLFVNLFTSKFKQYNLEDFFNKEYANIYETWSVFITRDLKRVIHSTVGWVEAPRKPSFSSHSLGFAPRHSPPQKQ